MGNADMTCYRSAQVSRIVGQAPSWDVIASMFQAGLVNPDNPAAKAGGATGAKRRLKRHRADESFVGWFDPAWDEHLSKLALRRRAVYALQRLRSGARRVLSRGRRLSLPRRIRLAVKKASIPRR